MAQYFLDFRHLCQCGSGIIFLAIARKPPHRGAQKIILQKLLASHFSQTRQTPYFGTEPVLQRHVYFVTASPYLYLQHFGAASSTFRLFWCQYYFYDADESPKRQAAWQILQRTSFNPGLSIQASAAALLVGLFVFIPDIHLGFILPLMMLFVGTLGLIGSNAVALILHHFKDISATANALTGVCQFTSGALAGLIWAGLQRYAHTYGGAHAVHGIGCIVGAQTHPKRNTEKIIKEGF